MYMYVSTYVRTYIHMHIHVPNNANFTFCRGTFSFSGETIEMMSLVMVGGAPGSDEGVEPNSRLRGREGGREGRREG